MADLPETQGNSQLLLYQTDDGTTRIEVRLEGETVWLTLNQMAALFQTTKQNISLHIQNIFHEEELSREVTVKEFLTVQREGSRDVRRRLEYFNLDIIISVGYRVKSHVATRFRIWATQRLREYIIDEVKQGGVGPISSFILRNSSFAVHLSGSSFAGRWSALGIVCPLLIGSEEMIYTR